MSPLPRPWAPALLTVASVSAWGMVLVFALHVARPVPKPTVSPPSAPVTLYAPRSAARSAPSSAPRPESPEVTVAVSQVQLTDEPWIDPTVDGDLLEYALERADRTGARRRWTKDAELRVGDLVTFELEPPRELRVSLLSVEGGSARLRLRLFKKGDKKVDTTVTVPMGRSFVLAGVPRGELVIVEARRSR